MYSNILVPIDPSHIDEADSTLDLAEHLKSTNGKIVLLSVVEDIPAVVVKADVPVADDPFGEFAEDPVRHIEVMRAQFRQ